MTLHFPADGTKLSEKQKKDLAVNAVVPLDGSETALRALGTVRQLLSLQPAIELHLVTVLDPKAVRGRTEHVVTETPVVTAGKMSVTAPSPRLVESHGEAMDRKAGEARNWLHDIATKEFPTAAAKIHVAWDTHAAEAINRLAEEIDAAVIVMATHGRSGISHVLAGSITEAVIRTATRPVLVHGPAGS